MPSPPSYLQPAPLPPGTPSLAPCPADEDSDDDYLAAAARTADAMAEAAADSDAIASDDDMEPPLMHPTFFQLKAKPPAAASGKFPPPLPVPPANVPPIFVMAPEPAASHPQQVGTGAGCAAGGGGRGGRRGAQAASAV